MAGLFPLLNTLILTAIGFLSILMSKALPGTPTSHHGAKVPENCSVQCPDSGASSSLILPGALEV